MRIDGRRRALGQALRPPLVVAPRVEGVPGEVEVVLVESGRHPPLRGPTLIRSPGLHGPRSATVCSPKSSVDVDRLVRLAVPAVLSLRDKPHHRGIALGERGLVREVGRGARRRDEREHGNKGAEHGRERVGMNRDSSRADAGRVARRGARLGYGSGTRVYETTAVSLRRPAALRPGPPPPPPALLVPRTSDPLSSLFPSPPSPPPPDEPGPDATHCRVHRRET